MLFLRTFQLCNSLMISFFPCEKKVGLFLVIVLHVLFSNLHNSVMNSHVLSSQVQLLSIYKQFCLSSF